MWKAAVASAVVGVATFAAVVLVGRDLAEAEPVENGSVPVAAHSWAERAGQICRESMGAVRAELAGPRALETEEATALRLYRETTQIEGELVERLRELPGAPGEAAAAVDQLAGQHARDVETVKRLEHKLDPQLILRELNAYERLATRLRTQFDGVGAAGCVRYLDPASYG